MIPPRAMLTLISAPPDGHGCAFAAEEMGPWSWRPSEASRFKNTLAEVAPSGVFSPRLTSSYGRWADAPRVAATSGLALNVTSVIEGIQVGSSGDDEIVKVRAHVCCST